MNTLAEFTDKETDLYRLFTEMPRGKRVTYLSGDMNQIHADYNQSPLKVARKLYENGRCLLTQEVTSSKVVPVTDGTSVIKNTYNYYLTRI